MEMSRVLGMSLLCIAACSGREVDGDADSGCESDSDCKGDRICVESRCEDPETSGTGGSGSARGGTGGTGTVSGGTSSFAGSGGSSDGEGGGSVTAGTGGESGSGGATGAEVMATAVAVDASAIVADPIRGKLYAVVTGSAASYANELVVIDAETAEVEASVLVGSDPDSLAISDDATKLWVGLHGALSLREVDLTVSPPEPGAQYVLPSGEPAIDAVHAGPMVVLPGEPDSVAVSLHYDGLSPSFAGLVIIDSGNPRPNGTPGHTGASRLAAGPPGYLFGFNDLSTGFQFFSIAIDEMGATQTEFRGLIDGFSTDIVYGADHVLATNGQVLDVSSPDTPVRAGTFPFSGLIVAEAASSGPVMLSSAIAGSSSSSSSASNLLVLRRLNLETFLQDREVPIAGRFANVRNFVEVRPGLFAFVEFADSFSSESGRVYVVSAPEIVE